MATKTGGDGLGGVAKFLQIVATAWSVAFATTARSEEPTRGMEVFFIDVLGGAATLIVTPERESILIDAGWPGQGDRDPKRIVHVVKEVAGLDRIDHMVVTHWHVDHFGGVAGVAGLLPIEHFWDRGLPEDQIEGLPFPEGTRPEDGPGLPYRKVSAGKRKALKAGDVLPLRGGVEAMVLAASGKVADVPGATANPLSERAPADKPVDKSDNALSLALRFRSGKFDFLDCGDLTWNVEKALVCPKDLIGPIDLFQVTHHGMDISNNPILLQTIKPTVAVMNNGPTKGGSAETVHRLKDLPSIQAAYQVHRNAKTGPSDNADPTLIANDDPAGGRFVRVSVSPDGSTFKVRFGADGPARTFESR